VTFSWIFLEQLNFSQVYIKICNKTIFCCIIHYLTNKSSIYNSVTKKFFTSMNWCGRVGVTWTGLIKQLMLSFFSAVVVLNRQPPQPAGPCHPMCSWMVYSGESVCAEVQWNFSLPHDLIALTSEKKGRGSKQYKLSSAYLGKKSLLFFIHKKN